MWIIRQQQETQEYPDYADLRVACKLSGGNIGELEWLLGDISEVLKLPASRRVQESASTPAYIRNTGGGEVGSRADMK